MRHIFNLLLIFIVCSLQLSAQTSNYQKLLDTAITTTNSIYVSASPIKTIRLNRSEMWDYYNNYIEDSKQMLDTIMFAQIIQNSKQPDTSPWKDSELEKMILVKSREEPVDVSYVAFKFNIKDNKQLKNYRKMIDGFNSLNSADKNIYSYSRPVFDNSKQFAIVQWDNGNGKSAGGGGIILFQLSGDSWEELGSVLTWKY
ncbi:MAG TPA: hypothetical protein VMI12_13285 [Puia sp.]|nr:hypothetical protein [Puia sp.]